MRSRRPWFLPLRGSDETRLPAAKAAAAKAMETRARRRAIERARERERGEEDEEWRSAFVPRERHLGIGLDKDNTHAWHKDYRERGLA